jgi:hypothetical protein
MLHDLIPCWKQDIQEIQANNPLAKAIPITDKSARQLYFAINGKKSITELGNLTQLDQQDFQSALRFLLKQNLIQLHDPDGKTIDGSIFIEPL